MHLVFLSVVLFGAASPAVPDSIDLARLSRFQASYFARSRPLIDDGNYLGVLQLLDSLQAEVGPSPRADDFARQMAGTFLSFVGQEQAALAAFRRAKPRPAAIDTAAFEGFTAAPALDAVVRLARNRKAVFVNEAHHEPRHRAFTTGLLRRLYALGFRYLALEALDERDTALAVRGYPVRATGFYTNEPEFGELVREALATGYTLVAYEATGDDMRTQEAREAAEARQLVERTFARDPNARVLVHAGYTHIDEMAAPGRARPMAVRFREATGIDPLTVDQVAMSGHGDVQYDDPRRALALSRSRQPSPFVLVRGDSCWSARPGVHDLTVIEPAESARAGRPVARWAGRRAVPVPFEIGGVDCVVSARRVEESADAVPADVLRVGPQGESGTLALPPGRYVVAARDGAGRLLREAEITVGP